MNTANHKEIDWRTEQIWTIDEMAQFLHKAPSTIKTYLCRCPNILPPRLKGIKGARWDKDIAIQFFQDNSIEARRLRRPRNN